MNKKDKLVIMNRVVDTGDQVSVNIDDDEILDAGSESDESSSISGHEQFVSFARNGMVEVGGGSSEYEIVKKSFLSGMGSMQSSASVVAIHKNASSSSTRKARVEAFRIFLEAVAEKCGGGNANAKHAWYSGSRDELFGIVSHGFSRCRRPANRDEIYGDGVHLVPAKFSIDGALSSVVDKDGLRHMLLCRVILGNMEVVSPGSKQFHPSSKEFDSGVDNLSDPRKYIVWSAFMNSHIFPNYIISFRAPGLEDFQRSQVNAVKPTSPWMSFPALMSILSRFLDPRKMALTSKYYSDFRQNKITRPQLINRVRQIAGDRLLIEVIKCYRNKVC